MIIRSLYFQNKTIEFTHQSKMGLLQDFHGTPNLDEALFWNGLGICSRRRLIDQFYRSLDEATVINKYMATASPVRRV
jgi:hypothetical protein